MKLTVKDMSNGQYETKDTSIKQVTVPVGRYITLEGKGSPFDSKEKTVEEAFAAITQVAYRTMSHMAIFKAKHYTIFPMEFQWFVEHGQFELTTWEPAELQYKVMYRIPEFVSNEVIEMVTETCKKENGFAAFDQIKIEQIDLGLCYSFVLKGSLDGMVKPLTKMFEQIKEDGYELNGYFQEVYIKDVFRTKPENLQTIVWQPVKKI